jgi:type IV secretion system protein VirB3
VSGPINFGATHIEGFEAPLHRSLAEPILLGGAPRAIAILNGTAAAALGLGLQQWVAGLILWAVGHSLAVFAARRDPEFGPVLARHLRQKGHLGC